MNNPPPADPKPPSKAVDNINVGQVCLETFNNVICTQNNLDRIRQIQGGGWENWLQVQMADALPGRPQLATSWIQPQVQREQPIYWDHGKRVDIWVAGGQNGPNAGIELKCKLNNETSDQFILRFTQDYSDKVHDGPSGGPANQYRNGRTTIWGIGFTDQPDEVRRILAQLQGMTPQTSELYRQGYVKTGNMYMIWYCEWYP
jgi:hypothetical protein